MKPSKAWHWNEADTAKWLEQARVYLLPYLVVIIPVIITQIPKDWAYATAVIWVLNRLYSAFLILKAGK